MKPQHAWLPLTLFVASIGACAEETSSADVRSELDARLARAAEIHHFGCRGAFACDRDRRVCDGAALQTKLAANEPVAIEYETGHTGILGVQHLYWFVDADHRGTLYYELDDDSSVSSDCGSYCGWHRRAFSRFSLELAPKAVRFASDVDVSAHDTNRFMPDDPAADFCSRD
jgi:hypothetical protein